MPGEPERCGIAQAALITGISKRALQNLARSIPGASKPAGRWLFVIADLRAWVAQINEPTARRKGSISGTASARRLSRPDALKVEQAYELALNGLSKGRRALR